jgi:predicted lipid-binding transport protein (Tim44 family)
MKGGLTRAQKINLRTEAKAPFRFARTFIFGGLAGGAGLGLIVILGRLARSIQGLAALRAFVLLHVGFA